MTKRALGRTCACGCLLAASILHVTAQEPDRSAATLRVDQRISALEREAERLAGSARTLVGELRTLEITRDLRAAEASRAGEAAAEASRELAATGERLAALEQRRVDQLPALKAQMVGLYKRGASGYLGVLFRAGTLRELGRTSRALAAAGQRNRRRVEAHRQTLAAVADERTVLENRAAVLKEREAAARRTRAAAEGAVAEHSARIAEIDARRDLTAQYMGELQTARTALLQQLDGREGDTPVTTIPLVPFRGALAWPTPGTLVGRFEQPANRLGGTAVRNGIEVAAELGAPVRAVHGGTVAHAEPFVGFGTLVILDHGANQYSLYGYLGATSVTVGQPVEPGAEVGQVGNAPAGPPALYFEMRIDGRSVDPVQWLEPR